MMWALEQKFYSSLLYMGGDGNLRDRYFKTSADKTKMTVSPGDVQAEEKK